MKRATSCIAGMLATAMAAAGCGKGTPPGGSGGAGGEGSGGATGGRTGGGKACPARTSSSVASHIVVSVRWPGSLAIKAGEGELHLWTKADLVFSGDAVTGKVRPCGTVIPALTRSAAVGGGKVQVEIPGAAWEAPAMPVFQVRGTTTGFDEGETITMDPVASIVGLTMTDPLKDPWPEEPSGLTTVDPDGDGQPGLLAIPRTDEPFGAPPLDLAGVLDPNGARADQIYLATRTVLALTGTRDSCTSAEGTAQVSRVDSHVVGCHVRGGGTCTASQASFVDMSQPRFTIESASFEMVDVPPDATCTDVRDALPPS